jgi:predicted MPP superfamily phosphohydrolase
MLWWPNFGVFLVQLTYFIGSFYLYKWFVRLLQPPQRLRHTFRLIFIILVGSFLAGKILGRYEFNSFNYFLSFFSSIGMGFTFFFCIFAGGSDLLRYFWKQLPLPGGILIPNSRAFRRTLVAVISGFALVMGGCALREAYNIDVTRLDLPLRGLPAEMEGLTLLQISDVHYGMLTENGRLSKIVARINDLNPDIVVITGDLVDESVSHMERMADPLSKLKSRLGVFAITGNHDYYAGADRVVAIMKGAGIRVLRNEVTVLPGGLQLLGIDDPTGARRVGAPVPDFNRLVSTLDPRKPSILLYHQPYNFEKTARAGVGLQLSGHTHGSQVLPLRPISHVLFHHLRGLYRQGDSYMYVTRGIGTGGPPMRLGSPPELVYIRLHSKV